jgi:hypothetical protein
MAKIIAPVTEHIERRSNIFMMFKPYATVDHGASAITAIDQKEPNYLLFANLLKSRLAKNDIGTMGGDKFFASQSHGTSRYEPEGKRECGDGDGSESSNKFSIRVNRHALTNHEIGDLYREIGGFLLAGIAFLLAYFVRRGMR